MSAGKEPGTSFRRKMVLLGVVLVIGLAYLLRGVLVPLFLAFLLAYALDPFVDRLEGLRVPRPLGAIAVMLGIVGLVSVVVVYTVPLFVDELSDASQTLPEKLTGLQSRLEPWFMTKLHIKLPHTMNDLSKEVTNRFQGDNALETARMALFGTLGYVGVALSALIVPVFALYLLIDFDRIVTRVEQLVPRRWVDPIADVARQIHKTLSGYVRGQLTANIVLAALYATGLRIVDIHLAVPIGVMTGMLAFVPYFGFTMGMLFALTMAVLDWQGAGTIVGVITVMGGVQLIDAMVITPRIVGRSVGLAPLEVILTMMAAGSLLGFLGVLLAVPLGAVVKILVQRAVKAYLASEFYNRAPARTPALVQVPSLALPSNASSVSPITIAAPTPLVTTRATPAPPTAGGTTGATGPGGPTPVRAAKDS